MVRNALRVCIFIGSLLVTVKGFTPRVPGMRFLSCWEGTQNLLLHHVLRAESPGQDYIGDGEDEAALFVPWHPCWTVGMYVTPKGKEQSKSVSTRSEVIGDSEGRDGSSANGERLSAGKFSKYAPSKELAEGMSSEVFRKHIYDKMMHDQGDRKRKNGGAIGVRASDEYFDKLNEKDTRDIRPTPKRSYGLNSQDSWK